MSVTKGEPRENGPANVGLPASESVAAPALSGADYDPAMALYDDLSVVRVSVGYLHAVQPETGVEVVFVPGEALPEWAREAQKARYQPAATKPANAGSKPKGQRSVKVQEATKEQ